MGSCSVRVDEGEEVAVGIADSYDVTGLSDGAHTIEVRCTDVAGNADKKAVTFYIDTDPFSPTGPYGPWALIFLIVMALATAITAFFWWSRWHKSRRPP